MRTSLFVRYGDQRFLIDTSPELRLQCTTHGVDAVDAVLYTHHHADHVAGLDDLRRFNWLMKKPIPCYGTEATLAGIDRMFSYAFRSAANSPHSRPTLEPCIIATEPFSIGNQTIIPVPVMHGPMPVMGFRFGSLAYCTDCNEISEPSLARLEGVDVLILDALRRTPHPAHFTIDQAVEVARKVGAKHTFFTHMTHELAHEATNAELPDGMALAYDGLRIAL
jgi:phosphoribosyl 1,2-cyclic phosphate phosphodiesterase